MATRRFLFQSAEGFYEEQATNDDLGMNGGKILNLADPTGPQDAATKFYVDSVATGLDLKASTRVKTIGDYSSWIAAGSGDGKTLTSATNLVGNNDFDGVTVALNNRVLVTGHGGSDTVADLSNGIYTVTQLANGSVPTVLTRATDADQSAEVTAGMFTFVTEGTASADTGWVLITNDAIVLDTTALRFSQFSSSVTLTFDQGLLLSGSSVTVELDTGANAQGGGAGGGSSGLEFDVNSAAGKLRAAVHATGGIQRSATGLQILLDPTANTAGNNPTLATSAAGITVLRAPLSADNYTADEAIAAGDPVAYSTATNSRVVKARADNDAKSRVIGVATTAASSAGDTIGVTRVGVFPGTLSGATVGIPIYLAATGGKSNSAPAGGNRVIVVGYAKNATDLDITIRDMGKKAA